MRKRKNENNNGLKIRKHKKLLDSEKITSEKQLKLDDCCTPDIKTTSQIPVDELAAYIRTMDISGDNFLPELKSSSFNNLSPSSTQSVYIEKTDDFSELGLIEPHLTELGDADRFEELVERDHQENLMRAWRRSRQFKTVPCPSFPPRYIKEPLELLWTETVTSKQRTEYNLRKYRSPKQLLIKKRIPVTDHQTLIPRSNRTYELRNAYTKREPIISSYFETHYKTHRKPPFRRVNVTFVE